jgi:multimeric flavodoxin WrbA
MKKILAVVGSPRTNGNTHILVSKIGEGAKSKSAKVDELLLSGLTINWCDGCHACWLGRQCSKNDDMRDIYQRIIQSDVIIFGTPVYWYGPTALMKAFIDRFVYFNCSKNRKKLRGKSAVIAIPFEDQTIETAEPVVDFFRRCFEYLHIEMAGKILVPGVGQKGQILQKADFLQKAYELGQNLV